MTEAEMPASDEFVERLAKELAISLSRSYTVEYSLEDILEAVNGYFDEDRSAYLGTFRRRLRASIGTEVDKLVNALIQASKPRIKEAVEKAFEANLDSYVDALIRNNLWYGHGMIS